MKNGGKNNVYKYTVYCRPRKTTTSNYSHRDLVTGALPIHFASLRQACLAISQPSLPFQPRGDPIFSQKTKLQLINMADTTSFLSAIADRKSIYALSNSPPISDARIIEVVTHCLKHYPSPFNVQSARLIVLLGPEHEKLWDLAAEVYQAAMGPEKFPFFKQKIDEYRAAYGSIL